MANLTVTIDDDVLKRARVRALLQDRSAVERFVARARQSRSGSGPAGRSWTREELHDRADVR